MMNKIRISLTSDTQSIAPMLNQIWYTLYSIWLFTVSDLKTIVVPKTIFGILSSYAAPVFGIKTYSDFSTTNLLTRIPRTTLWVYTILLPFVIDNQRLKSSVEEDKLNKPWRTIASGRMDRDRARTLMSWMYVASIAVSCNTGGLPHAFLGMLLGYWYNHAGGADSNCLVRNLINAFGYVTFSSGAMEVAMGVPLLQQEFRNIGFVNSGSLGGLKLPKLYQWLLMIIAVIFTSAHAQDMYDQVGDKMRGRRTVPLVIGDFKARLSLAIAVFFWSFVCPFFWELDMITYIFMGGISTFIAVRTLSRRSFGQDKVTFLIWNGWIMCLYSLPFCKYIAMQR